MKLHRGNFNSNKLFLGKTRLLKRTHTILEIGPGHGAMMKYLQNKGFNIIGLEINDKYIKSAKNKKA
jgi:16S rRNA A1518/A1519 N6-dimethyltransferase RsmA/KsgA/DIM1 with predicted DNA glycosylase/AP lyase activity